MMTAQEFNAFWKQTYPATIPLSYLFKSDYAARWFRIHSLPESKRYADTEEEWNILLGRHNQIISDLLGENAPVLLVTGDYNWNSPTDIHITEEEPVLKSYSFTRLEDISLYEISPDNHDIDQVYRPAFAETIWNAGACDELLKEIADWTLSAFWVSVDKNLLIAPYDGGVDFVLKDSETRDFYKQKYKDWLSATASGY
jgi:hypothetical protein